jgi:hypothetical protein
MEMSCVKALKHSAKRTMFVDTSKLRSRLALDSCLQGL